MIDAVACSVDIAARNIAEIICGPAIAREYICLMAIERIDVSCARVSYDKRIAALINTLAIRYARTGATITRTSVTDVSPGDIGASAIGGTGNAIDSLQIAHPGEPLGLLRLNRRRCSARPAQPECSRQRMHRDCPM